MTHESAAVSDELVRHALHTKHWVPACRERRSGRTGPNGKPAPLRYFTFCGEDPDDVVLLAIKGLLPHEAENGYESVTFFDRRGRDPNRAILALPGAQSFGADFLDTVLVRDELDVGVEADSSEAQQHQRLLQMRQMFRQRFPFDVVNFDLEEVLFRDSELPPGRLLEGLQKLFEWQHSAFEDEEAGFTLLMTAREPEPDRIGSAARELMTEVVRANLALDPALGEALSRSSGVSTADDLASASWQRLFEVALPKLLLRALRQAGWEVEGDAGVRVISRARQAGGVDQRLLHVMMCVRRRSEEAEEVTSEYVAAVSDIFGNAPEEVSGADVTSTVKNSYAAVQTRMTQNRGGMAVW